MIIIGNCLEKMREMADNSVDCIVTDPPYGLSFMGKKWDYELPDGQIWAEALRVCKPGAMMLCFGGPRTYHRLTCAIEDAGWEIRDCIMWMFGSGFPKSHNVSKAIDKAQGYEREYLGEGPYSCRKPHKYSGGNALEISLNDPRVGHPQTESASDLAKTFDGYGTALKPAYEPIIVAMKPIDGTYAHNADKWGVAGINIDACRIGTEIVGWGGHGSAGFLGDRPECHKALKSNECGGRPVQGRWPANIILDEEAGAALDEMTSDLKSGHRDRSKHRVNDRDTIFKIPNPIADFKDYADSGGASRFFYCPKASRSERNEGLEGFWFDNLELVLHNGTSFELEELWVLGDQNQVTSLDLEASQKKDTSVTTTWCPEDKECTTIWSGNENEGQFPMVIRYITSTGSKQTIELKTLSYYRPLSTSECIQDVIKTNEETGISLAENVGLRSILKRIFTKEKMASLRGVKNAQKKMPCLISVKEEIQRKNFHSTVKPLALMEYLIKLVMPPKDGVLLDPFAGSGSTLVAAKRLGVSAIGIELSAEYAEIAKARVAAAAKDKEREDEQLKFDFDKESA